MYALYQYVSDSQLINKLKINFFNVVSIYINFILNLINISFYKICTLKITYSMCIDKRIWPGLNLRRGDDQRTCIWLLLGHHTILGRRSAGNTIVCQQS